MTKRSMRSGIEVLDDLVSFFESSPAFISVACEKMRKTHGPNFKMATVKAILGLRTDLSKEDRAVALKVCEEILEEFKKNPQYDQIKGANGRAKGGGIFQNIDTSQAEKAAAAGDRDVDENGDDLGYGDGAEFNMDDFLKQGGINLEDEGEGDNIGNKSPVDQEGEVQIE